MSAKKRAVVICPGRGTYTKESLGSLFHVDGETREFINHLDQRRRANNELTITELDSDEKFKTHVHTKGENASPLIYACAKADYMAIDRDKFEVVAVAGNSMGWYLTLSMTESLDWDGSYDVINTMGSMMKGGLIGGQVIYPIVDETWNIDPKRQVLIANTLKDINSLEDHEAHYSIHLGGYAVIGANKLALAELLKRLPQDGDFPFQLINHGAFHTPLLREVSSKAFEVIPRDIFHQPEIPMVDGRGHIYTPHGTDIDDLYHYTLGHQVVEAYDFTKSIEVAIKEFAPDNIILLGPGATLGGAIGQTLIKNNWLGLSSKQDFIALQKANPFLLAMGIPEQKQLVI